jgi:uncharacterized membrane protein YkvA (DUF1232 family)
MWLLKVRKLLSQAGREALIMYFAILHPGTPRMLKVAGGAALVYLISPVDLIPDIPVVGWVDDALLLEIELREERLHELASRRGHSHQHEAEL